MMTPITVRSRAHRTLRKLSNFSMDGANLDPIVGQFALRPEEELIGAYQNPQPTLRWVVVTSLGLHSIEAGGSRYVPFNSIAQVDASDKADVAGDLVLSLASGERIVIPIRGGDGRFKDVFEFKRFLARVLEDQSGRSEA